MLFGIWKWWKMCPMELTHENVTYFEFFFFFYHFILIKGPLEKFCFS